MSDLTNAKVGDKLYIKSGHYDKGRIVPIDRITPTGRVITKAGEFNPNGRMRGGSSWQSTWSRLATEDDIAGIYHHSLVMKLTEFRRWEKLSAEDLKAASEIIAKYDVK